MDLFKCANVWMWSYFSDRSKHGNQSGKDTFIFLWTPDENEAALSDARQCVHDLPFISDKLTTKHSVHSCSPFDVWSLVSIWRYCHRWTVIEYALCDYVFQRLRHRTCLLRTEWNQQIKANVMPWPPGISLAMETEKGCQCEWTNESTEK